MRRHTIGGGICVAVTLVALVSYAGPQSQPTDAGIDRTVLPPPDPSFQGKIAVALKDSKPGYAKPLRAPEGAPNVLLIMGDDIVAEVENPDGKAEGMLVTLGGETGGYALLVQKCKPTFIYSWIGLERTTIASSEPLPKGKSTVRFDFAYDGGGQGKGGMGTLSVKGKKVGEGRIAKTVPVYFSTDDTFDVGEDWGTPVAPTYETPFKFTGTLKKVTVEVEPVTPAGG